MYKCLAVRQLFTTAPFYRIIKCFRNNRLFVAKNLEEFATALKELKTSINNKEVGKIKMMVHEISLHSPAANNRQERTHIHNDAQTRSLATAEQSNMQSKNTLVLHLGISWELLIFIKQ